MALVLSNAVTTVVSRRCGMWHLMALRAFPGTEYDSDTALVVPVCMHLMVLRARRDTYLTGGAVKIMYAHLMVLRAF